MKEFSLPLKHKYQRPIIELYKLPALIDTGAVILVFSMYPTIIEKFFDAKIRMYYEFDTINEKFIVRVEDAQSIKRDFKIKYLSGRLFPQIDGILFQDIDISL